MLRACRPLPLVLLLAALACGRPAPPRTAPVILPVPQATPVPTPLPEPEPPVAPEPAPTPEPPPTPPATLVGGDLMVRVGLLTDQTGITFPAGAPDLRVAWEQKTWAVLSSVRIEPAPGSTEAGVYRVQIAALKDAGQAQALAANLRRASGEATDALFDAESGLYRVRLGRYATHDAAETARRGLARYGVGDAWVVSEGGGVRQPALRVTQAGSTVTVPGRWLAVEARDVGIAVAKGRYRGRILLFLNDRGTLNVIDELPLEQYLRGVVPSELGPSQYPEVEALKAQAVAARTYVVRNLGEFRQEGYDICATPRCQAYDGVGAEHPRSDQAVAETRGQVLLWNGQPIDALYSSTCGGHTEDVETIFPLKKDEPYLKGVACLEAGVETLAGSPAGAAWPGALDAALLGGDGATPQAYGRQLAALAQLAGVPQQAGTLQSFDAREVRRYVAAVFDLALDARLFVAPADLPYLVQSPPAGWSEDDRRLAALFVKLGLTDGAPAQLQPAQRDELLYRLALYLRVLREEPVTFLATGAGKLHVRGGERADPKDRDVPLPAILATFRRTGDATTGGPLALVPGDEMQLVWQGDALVAVVQSIHPQGVAYDRSSSWSSWRRFRSDKDVATLVQQRYPGFPFRDLEVVSRGVSGRVGELRLLGADGRSEMVDGLAVRWTLDLPDTLFTMKRLRPERGEPGWLFTGRGWGHGVGLCQVGAYGMALRGHDYREILAHYYPGAVLGALPASAGAASAAVRLGADATARR